MTKPAVAEHAGPGRDADKLFLRVGTYNIYNTTARYEDGRKELLRDTVSKLPVDVLGLQEVRFGQDGQTQLFREAGWKHAFEAPLISPIVVGEIDPTFRIDGNALMVRSDDFGVAEESHKVLQLSEYRAVQRLRLQLTDTSTGTQVVVANTHLHWCSDPLGMTTWSDAVTRGEQLKRALEWLDTCRNYPTVFVGDFNNYFPEEEIHTLLSDAGFESAYKAVHGADPEVTCPTPLEAPGLVPDDSVVQSCDYVLFRQAADSNVRLIPVAAQIAGNFSCVNDSTLYPSDHFAVCAAFQIGQSDMQV